MDAPRRDRPSAWPPPSLAGATHVYLAHFRVRHHQLDPLGHVNNATYLNYLEQAAIDHAAAGGYDVERLRALGGLFIASRHEIDFLRPAVAGDWLRVTTWGLALHGARALRAYEIHRLSAAELALGPPRDRLLAPAAVPPPTADLLVRAQTHWAFVDPATNRPRRIPAALRDAFVRPVE